MVYKLKTCCCCGDLRTGTVIIAALSAVWGIVLTVLFVIGKHNETYSREYVRNSNSPRAVQITGILLYLAFTMTSFIMIMGGVKRNWKLIVPWLVLDGLIIGLQFIGLILYSVLTLLIQPTVGFLVIFIGLIYTAICVYLWYVPFTYHLNLREESQVPAYNLPAVYCQAPPAPQKYMEQSQVPAYDPSAVYCQGPPAQQKYPEESQALAYNPSVVYGQAPPAPPKYYP